MATLLFVDDEEALRRAVTTWLTRKGHIVHSAGTVASARTLLEQHDIDGVFIDLWLGTESGLELQDWIDENRPEYSGRIVFVTGDVVATDRTDRALGALGHPVLMKPFELQQIDSWVSHFMGVALAERDGESS